VAVIREKNPLPAICGRVCFHPCEDKCLLAELDKPVAIKLLKRFAIEYADKNLWKQNSKIAPAEALMPYFSAWEPIKVLKWEWKVRMAQE
jgi:NADPH-dependent glutamate synthase beta subunit-like oxidoreductase